jgi:diguanylate cyclase (GGDEF)-like protein
MDRPVLGRLAGVLFLVGSLATIPVNRLFEPAVGPWADWFTALGVASGALCFLLPWERLGDRSLHVVAVVATVEVAMTMWGVRPHGEAYVWFLVFVVVFVAYAFEDRRAVAGHTLLAVSALVVPPVLGGGGNALAEMLIAAPILVVASAVVVHLREGLQAQQAAVAAEARSDPLTGAGNLRMLTERLDYELPRHARAGRPLALLVLDLDRFKAVNDTLGHPLGDQLLREVAAVLRDTVRGGDTVVRQGGDEFCVLAPETTPEEARELAGRIKQALHRLVAVGEPLSASVGVAAFPADATTPDLLLAQADLQQRRDKAAGRGPARGALRAVR